MQFHIPRAQNFNQSYLLRTACILFLLCHELQRGWNIWKSQFSGNSGFQSSVPVLQYPTWTCLILDVSCDNSPAKYFEIGFLHSFGGWHLIWAQCEQQTFMGSPKKEALLLIITSTRVSSYRPPIMVMPLSTLIVQEVSAPILLSKAPLLQPQRNWSMRSMLNATMHP
jgi:hypothetical protein